jgi:hypothetical protein
MTLDEFWEHIRVTKCDPPHRHAKALTERLTALPTGEILDFDHWWDLLHRESNDRTLWGAAYLINAGCSDDGFCYFRDWLLLQGRAVYQAAVANPDWLANVVDPKHGGNFECECRPGWYAWFQATGTVRDEAGYDALQSALEARHPKQPSGRDWGERWDFDDREQVRLRLPRLAALYFNRG